MKALYFFLTICFFTALKTNAQDFSTKPDICDTCKNDLYFNLESTFFNKNNEYFSEFTEGFTGIGAFLKPSIEYHLADGIKLETGVFLLQYFGESGINQIKPIIRFEHAISKNLRFVVGSLYGTLQHGLEEPLLRFDRYYQDHMEYGSQILFENNFLKADAWLNWDLFIQPDAPYQEELELGLTSSTTLLDNDIKVKLPIQLLLEHKGGQIDNTQERNFFLYNGMGGLTIELPLRNNQILQFKPLYFYYTSFKNRPNSVNSQKFDDGEAFYGQIHYKRPHFNSMIGIWLAKEFIASNGEYLFYSISEFNPNFIQPNRSLITGKLEYYHEVTAGVELGFRTDLYYSTINQSLEYSIGIYTLINRKFFISKLKSVGR